MLAVGVAHPQDLERGKTDGFLRSRHGWRRTGTGNDSGSRQKWVKYDDCCVALADADADFNGSQVCDFLNSHLPSFRWLDPRLLAARPGSARLFQY